MTRDGRISFSFLIPCTKDNKEVVHFLEQYISVIACKVLNTEDLMRMWHSAGLDNLVRESLDVYWKGGRGKRSSRLISSTLSALASRSEENHGEPPQR